MARQLPALTPLRTVLDNPICERALKANVATGFLGLDPLVFQDFLALRLKFPVKGRVFQQIGRRRLLLRFVRHNREFK